MQKLVETLRSIKKLGLEGALLDNALRTALESDMVVNPSSNRGRYDIARAIFSDHAAAVAMITTAQVERIAREYVDGRQHHASAATLLCLTHDLHHREIDVLAVWKKELGDERFAQIMKTARLFIAKSFEALLASSPDPDAAEHYYLDRYHGTAFEQLAESLVQASRARGAKSAAR